MKVMLTENQYPTLGLVNGTIGIVHEIVLDHDIPRNDTYL
jgi:ATP-dependent exoDNAse (exonuclease V) alpha subunit